MSQIPKAKAGASSSAKKAKANPRRAQGVPPQQNHGAGDGDDSRIPAKKNMLTLLLNVANQSLEYLGLNKTMVMKDFDNMTPELFRRFMMLLLCSTEHYSESDFIASRVEKLDQTGSCKAFETLTYDPTVYRMYWHIKNLFPENDTMFDYSIMFFPGLDPRRTKNVIVYIAQFVLFSETVDEKFENAYIEMLARIKDMESIREQIAEAEGKIKNLTEMHEEWENGLPQVMIQVKEANTECENLQHKVRGLQAQVGELRKAYVVAQTECTNSEFQYESLKSKLQHIEEEQVHNPVLIRQRHADERELLERAMKKREEIGEKIKELGDVDNFIENVTEEAQQVVSSLEESVSYAQNFVELTEKTLKAEAHIKVAKQKHDDALENLKRCEVWKEKMKTKITTAHKEMAAEKEEHAEKLERIRKELQNLKSKSEDCAASLSELVPIETTALANIHKMQREIQRSKEHLQETIPNRYERLLSETKEYFDRLAAPLELKIKLFHEYNGEFDDSKS